MTTTNIHIVFVDESHATDVNSKHTNVVDRHVRVGLRELGGREVRDEALEALRRDQGPAVDLLPQPIGIKGTGKCDTS